jgi:hypothetical protein
LSVQSTVAAPSVSIAGVAQPGDGGAHGVGQPSKALTDLGDRSALGALEHAN